MKMPNWLCPKFQCAGPAAVLCHSKKVIVYRLSNEGMITTCSFMQVLLFLCPSSRPYDPVNLTMALKLV